MGIPPARRGFFARIWKPWLNKNALLDGFNWQDLAVVSDTAAYGIRYYIRQYEPLTFIVPLLI